MKLPDEPPAAPYAAVAFRLTHYHFDENDEELDEPGTLVVEFAGKLPGTEAEVVVPFEMTAGMAIQLVDELVAQYRCLVHGPLDETPGEEDEE